MSFSYEDRAVWLEELEGGAPGHGYAMCTGHADAMTPPMGWTLTDRRNVTRLFATGSEEVA